MSSHHLIVTHHDPDLDAIGAVWLLKRFDAQHYADARVAFVDPGRTIDPTEAEELGYQMHEVTHVDTGLGKFDHHQPERGHEQICATSLVYDYICHIHPEAKNDEALRYFAQYVTEIDHFGEINWPDANSPRYCFMLDELIHAYVGVDPHTDESQLHFGMQCLDCAYHALDETFAAQHEMSDGETFEVIGGKCLSIENRNDQIMKFAQKAGYTLVIRKDQKSGEMRIKARPDSPIELKPLADKIMQMDRQGTWYYHPSGKMLLNGSSKRKQNKPTPLSLQEVTELVKELYAA